MLCAHIFLLLILNLNGVKRNDSYALLQCQGDPTCIGLPPEDTADGLTKKAGLTMAT